MPEDPMHVVVSKATPGMDLTVLVGLQHDQFAHRMVGIPLADKKSVYLQWRTHVHQIHVMKMHVVMMHLVISPVIAILDTLEMESHAQVISLEGFVLYIISFCQIALLEHKQKYNLPFCCRH